MLAKISIHLVGCTCTVLTAELYTIPRKIMQKILGMFLYCFRTICADVFSNGHVKRKFPASQIADKIHGNLHGITHNSRVHDPQCITLYETFSDIFNPAYHVLPDIFYISRRVSFK